MSRGPLELVVHVASILDDLGIAYAVGGSIASSLIGEPRTTVDVDIAAGLDPVSGERLLERVDAEFYVPRDSARTALRTRESFNLLDRTSSLKVDLFVAGDTLLDRRQLERRVRVELPGAPDGIWITSPEDQVLRKLDWFRRGGSISDRQWRDVVGMLRVVGPELDRLDLERTAAEIGLAQELERAWSEVPSAQ